MWAACRSSQTIHHVQTHSHQLFPRDGTLLCSSVCYLVVGKHIELAKILPPVSTTLSTIPYSQCTQTFCVTVYTRHFLILTAVLFKASEILAGAAVP